MATHGVVGSLAALWRFPVKSMGGERLERVELTRQGLVGDRAFALIDNGTGEVVSAKSVRLFPNVLNCRAAFVNPPEVGRELPPVRIDLPNGRGVVSGSSDVDRVLSAYFRRDVTLGRAAPEAGVPSSVPVGSFFDLFVVSVLTTSTLARLSELQPQSRFDQRRFRMNVIVATGEAGFVENDWIGREVTIGDVARLRLAIPDSRCVMTTLAQDDLPSDADVLRALGQHNRLEGGDGGQYPCAGVYAEVGAPGAMRLGDRVELI